MTTAATFWLRASGLLVGVLLLTSCRTIVDYGRSGIYQLAFQSAGATASPRSARQRQVIDWFRATLRADKYRQWTGRREFWTKGGSYVEWTIDASGELTLKVHAFGGADDMRESERMELELMRFIASQSDIRVASMEPTADTWK